MKLIYALRFLTTIPIPFSKDEPMDGASKSTHYFPIVGLIIGGILYGTWYLTSFIWSSQVVSAAVLCLWALITGALHLDGLSDSADGLGGGKDPQHKLEIMKDSRTGAFGAVTLIIFLIFKWAMINEVIENHIPLVLLTAPVGARWIILLVMLMFPSASEKDIGTVFKKENRWPKLIPGAILTLLVFWFFWGGPGLAVLVLTAFLAILFAWRVSGKLGGLTGDVYGATIEISELIILTLITPAWRYLGQWM